MRGLLAVLAVIAACGDHEIHSRADTCVVTGTELACSLAP